MRHYLLLMVFVCHVSYADELTHDYVLTGQYAVQPAQKTVEKDSPQRHTITKNVGTHSHRCEHCGTTWSHTNASFGNRSAHTCPKCGRVEWDVLPGSERTVAVQVAAPSVPAVQVQKTVTRTTTVSGSNCPGGVCPVQIQRPARTFFFWR